MTARPASPLPGLMAGSVRRAAVIGAGVMGGGIAAQFANAGIPVDLLDVPAADASGESPAQAGIARQIKANGFMSKDAVGLVRPGDTENDLGRLADADWIVEAVVERLDIKRDLYARIDRVRRPGTIVSSNTSTIPRAALVDGMSDGFAADFLITHFFNPPRMMRLVELVTGPENAPETVESARNACRVALGKTIVDCRDTPGFIANRIGCYWLAVGILEALRLGLTPEEADTVMGAFGVPRTGVFGLIDLVGIDIVPQVWGSLMEALPSDDAIHAHDLPGASVIRDHIAAGRFGRKAKAGFYRRAADRSMETFDMETGAYRKTAPFPPAELPGGGRDASALIQASGKYGDYARSVLTHLVRYTATHAPEIADDVQAIDTAMVLGYAWREGPFRLADTIGVRDLADRMGSETPTPSLLETAATRHDGEGDGGGFYTTDGRPLATDGTRRPRRADDGTLDLSRIKAGAPRLLGNEAASLWDIGDGVACLEIHTKLNALSTPVFDVLEETIERANGDFQALVIGNDDARAFSAGADLAHIVSLIEGERLDELDAFIARGQKLFRALRHGETPVVAAMHGLALGGGLEIGLHAHAIVAHAELYACLPEVLVGLIPAWGGCTQLLLRAQSDGRAPKGPVAPAMRVFETIAFAKRSASAQDARALGILGEQDEIVMNRDLLLTAAKARALRLADATKQKPADEITVSGASGKIALMNTVFGLRKRGVASETDEAIADALAGVLSGGASASPEIAISDVEMMNLEREALLALAELPATKERIAHMLANGKPLRN